MAVKMRIGAPDGPMTQEELVKFGELVFKALEAYKASESWRLEIEAENLQLQADRLHYEAQRMEREAKYIQGT